MTISSPAGASGSPRWVTPTQLADLRAEPVLDGAGRIRDPLVCVDLDETAEPSVVAAAVRAAAAAERIAVGVASRLPLPPFLQPLVAALDVSLVPAGGTIGRELVGVTDPVAHAAGLHAAVAANPQAATVLAGLLRWSGGLPVPAALDAESLAYSTLLGGREFRRWLDGRGHRPPPPPATADPVLVDRDGPVLRVRLNHPERRNAYGRALRDALVAALEIAVLDTSVERVVLDGAGPSFSSGGDLDEFGTTPDIATAHLVRTRAGAAHLLHRLADRVEVRLTGTCLGAGIELPAFAGSVVAAPGTTVQLPEIRMGLIPGAGGTASIPRRIGRWRTLHLALTGTALDARTALEWGLVDRVESSSVAVQPHSVQPH